MVFALLFLRLQSAIRSLNSFYLTLEPIVQHPHATYSEKMSMRYPIYFDYISQVKALTPDDGTIYLSPIQIIYGERMWPIANLQITSALLFPRKVIFFNDKSLTDSDYSTYVVITNGFPQFKIKAKRIYVIGANVEKIFGNYDPANFNNGENGLIQL